MARLTPEQITEKHARRLKGSLSDVQAGIMRVTTSPTAQAAAKKDKMLSRLTEAVNSGRWARGLQRVSLEQWKQAAAEKGVQRISQGIDNAAQKMNDFYRDLNSHIDSGLGKLNSMPDVTIDDGINRASAWIRHMSTFRRK